MKAERKTKKQLINELAKLHQRIVELEASAAGYKQIEKDLHESEASFDRIQRNYHINYEIKRVLGILLLIVIAIPVAIFTDGISDNVLRVGLKLLQLIIFFLGLWMYLPRGEVEAGTKAISQGVLRNGIRRSFSKIWQESEK